MRSRRVCKIFSTSSCWRLFVALVFVLGAFGAFGAFVAYGVIEVEVFEVEVFGVFEVFGGFEAFGAFDAFGVFEVFEAFEVDACANSGVSGRAGGVDEGDGPAIDEDDDDNDKLPADRLRVDDGNRMSMRSLPMREGVDL
jgi:hypothetical protein